MRKRRPEVLTWIRRGMMGLIRLAISLDSSSLKRAIPREEKSALWL